MIPDIYPFFEWCEASLIGETVRRSLWLFPVIEAFHLVALAALGGLILAVDMKLLGLVFPEHSVLQLSRDMRPWMNGSLAVILVSGILLFLSEAVKCYYNQPFWLKMGALFLALVFTYTVRDRVINSEPESVGPVWGRVTALTSLFLWGMVAWGGRWIGFWG
jgi:hypothetical protein